MSISLSLYTLLCVLGISIGQLLFKKAAATLPATQSDPVIQALEESGDYFSLFNSILGIDPNNERIFGN